MTEGEWVFTDERFEDMKIVCRGRCTFNIYVHCPDGLPGYTDFGDNWFNTDVFTHNQREDSYDVDYDFALQAAKDHFDYMWAEHLEESDEGLILGDDLGKEVEDTKGNFVCPECQTEYEVKDSRYLDPIRDHVVRALCPCGKDVSWRFREALKGGHIS